MVKCLISLFGLAVALVVGACAALQPPDTNGPRSNVQLYPIGMADPAARLEVTSLAWYRLSQRYGLPERTEASLQPHTATIQSLPANLATAILLPKVGSGTIQTEEETREALRRFIVEWRQLIGADPEHLSLVERNDETSGIKVARYEQRPFRYPLRGGFGNLIIRFRSDRRLVGLSSNCLPNADRLQAALGSLTPKVTREEAANHIKGLPITITDDAGRPQTLTLPSNVVAEARQLVVYALPSRDQTEGLRLHLAWEIDVANGPTMTIYLDAISDQVIAGSRSQAH